MLFALDGGGYGARDFFLLALSHRRGMLHITPVATRLRLYRVSRNGFRENRGSPTAAGNQARLSLPNQKTAYDPQKISCLRFLQSCLKHGGTGPSMPKINPEPAKPLLLNVSLLLPPNADKLHWHSPGISFSATSGGLWGRIRHRRSHGLQPTLSAAGESIFNTIRCLAGARGSDRTTYKYYADTELANESQGPGSVEKRNLATERNRALEDSPDLLTFLAQTLIQLYVTLRTELCPAFIQVLMLKRSPTKKMRRQT